MECSLATKITHIEYHASRWKHNSVHPSPHYTYFSHDHRNIAHSTGAAKWIHAQISFSMDKHFQNTPSYSRKQLRKILSESELLVTIHIGKWKKYLVFFLNNGMTIEEYLLSDRLNPCWDYFLILLLRINGEYSFLCHFRISFVKP